MSPAPLLLALLLPLLLPGGAHGACNQLPNFRTCETTGDPGAAPYDVNTRVTYQCRPGYKAIQGKPLTIVCLENSTWSQTSELCTARECVRQDVQNGRVVDLSDVKFGATISFTCDEGYRLIGVKSVTCVIKGPDVGWDKSFPTCDAIPCLPPPDITNGTITEEAADYVFGMSVTYKCNSDLSLIGNASIHCTTEDKVNGVWSGPAPTCKAVSCSNPEITNGKKTSGFGPRYSYNDAVAFECHPHYRINGSSWVRCGANSTWEPPLPTCYLSLTTQTSSTTPFPSKGTKPPSGPATQAATTTHPPKGTKPDSGKPGAATMVSVGSMPLMVAVLLITFHICYLI